MTSAGSKKIKNNIIIFCDGTSNGALTFTNVRRLYKILTTEPLLEREGIVNHYKYFPGVGMGIVPKIEAILRKKKTPFFAKLWQIVKVLFSVLINFVFAQDFHEKVTEAYSAIVEKYDPEKKNQIWIFGFSRGAYTARWLANMIKTCGVVKNPSSMTLDDDEDGILNEYGLDEYMTKLVGLAYYKQLIAGGKNVFPDGGHPTDFRKQFSHAGSEDDVFFLGCWDTVGSVGVAKYLQGWGWQFDTVYDQQVSPTIKHVYHALSTHENMQLFEPSLIAANPGQNLVQKWFPGYHLDVGGCVGRQDIANITLKWMVDGINRTHALGFQAPETVMTAYDFFENFPKDCGMNLWGLVRVFFYFVSYAFSAVTEVAYVFGRNVYIAVCNVTVAEAKRWFGIDLYVFFFRDRVIPGADKSVLWDNGKWSTLPVNYPSRTREFFDQCCQPMK